MKFNRDVDIVQKWCNSNGTMLDTGKTKVIMITTHQRIRHVNKTELNIILRVQIDRFKLGNPRSIK